MCYYQFRRRHDYPPHKKRCLVKPPPNTKKNVVLFWTVEASICQQNLYEKLQKYDVWSKPPKNGSFVVDCNSIDSYYIIGGFVVDRKSIDLIDLLTKSIRKASEMRLA